MGGLYCTNNGKITKSVTKQKWIKGRTYVLELQQEYLENKDVILEFKRLERNRGFFCHLAMVFQSFTPYLKGFHLTLASHIPKRNSEGLGST